MKRIAVFSVFSLAISAISERICAAEATLELHEPIGVVQAYLRATYARDFVAAFQFISSEDRRVRGVCWKACGNQM